MTITPQDKRPDVPETIHWPAELHDWIKAHAAEMNSDNDYTVVEIVKVYRKAFEANGNGHTRGRRKK